MCENVCLRTFKMGCAHGRLGVYVSVCVCVDV